MPYNVLYRKTTYLSSVTHSLSPSCWELHIGWHINFLNNKKFTHLVLSRSTEVCSCPELPQHWTWPLQYKRTTLYIVNLKIETNHASPDQEIMLKKPPKKMGKMEIQEFKLTVLSQWCHPCTCATCLH